MIFASCNKSDVSAARRLARFGKVGKVSGGWEGVPTSGCCIIRCSSRAVRTQPQPGSLRAQSGSAIDRLAAGHWAGEAAAALTVAGRLERAGCWRGRVHAATSDGRRPAGSCCESELMQTAMSTGIAMRAPLSRGGCQWKGASCSPGAGIWLTWGTAQSAMLM